MSGDEQGSISRWIGDLKAGGDSAAQHLWERFFERLVRLARKKLRAGRRRDAVADEEDAVVSAFESFCRGAAAGRFPALSDRDDLWRLLVVITVRKALSQVERGQAIKRGAGKRLTQSAFEPGAEHGQADGLDFLAGDEPSPELAIMVAEEYQNLREALGDDSLRRVLDLRLEGYNREEIADQMGLSCRTVTRKLELIRNEWLARCD
jgi:DNA-directed RNA polymerase specialized sigma24 family protein